MGNESASLLQALHDDLDLLKNAIDGEDHDMAQRIVAGHDQRVHDYIQSHGVDAAPAQLQALLEQQHAVTARMRELRDEAEFHLRRERQSTRAASAYLRAGALA